MSQENNVQSLHNIILEYSETFLDEINGIISVPELFHLKHHATRNWQNRIEESGKFLVPVDKLFFGKIPSNITKLKKGDTLVGYFDGQKKCFKSLRSTRLKTKNAFLIIDKAMIVGYRLEFEEGILPKTLDELAEAYYSGEITSEELLAQIKESYQFWRDKACTGTLQ